MPALLKYSVAALLFATPIAAVAQTQAGAAVAATTAGDRSSILLESGTGKVVALQAQAANVFVADPKVAEVRPASASSLFVFGVGAGHTTVAALDNNGRPVAQFDITVQPSNFGASQAQGTIARMVRGSNVRVQAQSKG